MNWCCFCGKEIDDNHLACPLCRHLVDQLDRKNRRIFFREEKRLADIAALKAAIETLRLLVTRNKKAARVELLKEYLRRDVKQEQTEKETRQ